MKLEAIFIQESAQGFAWQFVVRPANGEPNPENMSFACEIPQTWAYEGIQPQENRDPKTLFQDALAWARKKAIERAEIAFANPQRAIKDTKTAYGL